MIAKAAKQSALRVHTVGKHLKFLLSYDAPLTGVLSSSMA